MPRITTPGRQHLDRNGNPLAGGLLYTREIDATTNKAVYPTEADFLAETNALDNPIELDDQGREPDMWGSGSYWMNLEDKNNNQIPEWPKSPVEVDAVINTPDLFYGLTLSNNSTDSDHDIDIAVGATMDSTGATRINLTSIFVKQIDSTWAAGTDSGGMASGSSLSTNTWYHVFAVVVGGTVDVIFDTSIVCANGVANNAVTSYQYINSVLTDSSSNILAFVNKKDVMWLDVPINSTDDNNPGSSAQTVTLQTPLAVQVLAEVGVIAEPGASRLGDILIYSPDQTATTPSATVADIASTTDEQAINKKLLTNTSSQIKYICSTGADGDIRIITIGWEVLR